MTDRLALIKARHAEAGGGDGDFEWLVAEVERLRRRFISQPGRVRAAAVILRRLNDELFS